MDWLIEFGTAPAPLWAALLLIALAGAAGWWWGRSVEPADRPATVRAEKFAAGRVTMEHPATKAVTRALAEPPAVAGSDLPTRYGATLDATSLAADWPPPALSSEAALAIREDTSALVAAVRTGSLIEASSLGTPEAVELRRSVTAAGELTGMPAEQADWDGAYDTDEPDDDDPPEDPRRVTSGPPFGGSAEASPTSVVPRYPQMFDPSRAKPWPAGKGVTPNRWSMYRWRAARWSARARLALVAVRRLGWAVAGAAVAVTPRLLLAVVVLAGLWSRHTAGPWLRRRRPGLRQWAVQYRLRWHRGRHEAGPADVSWWDVAPDLSRRWANERRAAKAGLPRYLQSVQITREWTRTLGVLRNAMLPPARTVPPSLPSLGCTP